MKAMFYITILLTCFALAGNAWASDGEEGKPKPKTVDSKMTVSSARNFLREVLDRYEMDGITQVFSVSHTGITTVVKESKHDFTYTIEFLYANIKSYEWENDVTLVLTAKEKGSITRKEKNRTSSHSWSEWTLVFKPNTDKEQVGAALELLVAEAT